MTNKWCASPHPIDRLALADVRKGIAGLQQTFSKQKTTIEKLLPEIALLKRQVKALEDAHNKSVQNSLTHLHDRMAVMESKRRVGNESAIVKLQTRLEAAEDELRGTARLADLPAWITDRSVMDPGTPMALSPDYLAALIDLRVAELRELAARTAVEYWRARPTLAEQYFPTLPRASSVLTKGNLVIKRN